MEVVKLVLLLLFGLTFAEENTEERTSTPCTTHWNRPGNCIHVTECPKIRNILKMKEHSEKDIAYLANVSCRGPVRVSITDHNEQVHYLMKISEGFTVCCEEEINEDGIKLLNTTDNFETCGTFSDLNVLNDGEINIHSMPWLALLRYGFNYPISYGCVGTLITKRFVLTSARCLSYGRPVFQVRLGEHHIAKDGYCNSNNICEWGHVDFDVEKTILHNGFSYSNDQNNIALIKLARDVEYNDHIRPACLPLSQELREKGQTQTNFISIGFGWTWIDIFSEVPMQEKLYRVNCNTSISTVNPKTHICTFGGRDDSCVVEGGNPLMYPQDYYGNQRFILFGILSFGPLFCDSEYGAYTNVAEYLPWISQNIIQ